MILLNNYLCVTITIIILGFKSHRPSSWTQGSKVAVHAQSSRYITGFVEYRGIFNGSRIGKYYSEY